jgi:hypothetical protein
MATHRIWISPPLSLLHGSNLKAATFGDVDIFFSASTSTRHELSVGVSSYFVLEVPLSSWFDVL